MENLHFKEAYDKDLKLTLFSRKFPRFSPSSFFLLQNIQQNRTSPASTTMIADSKSRNQSIALSLPDGNKNKKALATENFQVKIYNYGICIVLLLTSVDADKLRPYLGAARHQLLT